MMTDEKTMINVDGDIEDLPEFSVSGTMKEDEIAMASCVLTREMAEAMLEGQRKIGNTSGVIHLGTSYGKIKYCGKCDTRQRIENVKCIKCGVYFFWFDKLKEKIRRLVNR